MNALTHQNGLAVLAIGAIVAALVVGLAFAGTCW
jgi:hypothetical protein